MEDYVDLLSKNKRKNMINTMVQWLFIISDIFLILLFFRLGFGIVYMGFFLVLVFVSTYANIIFFKKKKLNEYESIGKYNIEEIREIIKEVFQNINEKEKPHIYIFESSTMTAFTTDSIFNFIPQLNAVYLSEDLFRHLKPEEFKAVLYHELGHYYYYMNPFAKNIFPVDVFSVLFPFLIFLVMRINSPLLLFLGVFSFSILVRNLVFSNPKDYEYLSDFFSAQKNGILNIINALIVISKKNEVDVKISRYLVERISKDRRLSYRDFEFYYNSLKNELPYEFQNFKEVSEVIDNFLYDNATEDIPEINEEGYEFEEIHNWSEFDLNHNFRIEEEEYNNFLESLMNQEEDNYNAIHDTMHPTLKNRILFLAANKEYI